MLRALSRGKTPFVISWGNPARGNLERRSNMSTSKRGAEASASARANGHDRAIEVQSRLKELEQLIKWQSSPAGLIASYVVGLVCAIAELNVLSRDPALFRLLAAEVADLEFISAEIRELISRIRCTKGAAA